MAANNQLTLLQVVLSEEPTMNMTRDHFFNARMLTEISYELILRSLMQKKFDKIANEGYLERYPEDERLNQALDDVENNEQAFIMEIVVGRGKNSSVQFSQDRPILRTTRAILDSEPRCIMYTMFDEATVFAMFDALNPEGGDERPLSVRSEREPNYTVGDSAAPGAII